MSSLLFLIIGILIIIISIIFITNQSNKSNVSEEFLKKDDELVITIESLENIIGDINHTFNDTIKEIEKRYEELDSKIQHVDEKVIEKYRDRDAANLQYRTNYENNLNYDIDDQNPPLQSDMDEQNKEINNKTHIKDDGEKKNEALSIKASQIIELKDRGLSAQQIAKELNIGTGEVMLILNLIRSK